MTYANVGRTPQYWYKLYKHWPISLASTLFVIYLKHGGLAPIITKLLQGWPCLCICSNILADGED